MFGARCVCAMRSLILINQLGSGALKRSNEDHVRQENGIIFHDALIGVW